MKYPRTYHLPWSPGRSAKDEKLMETVDSLIGTEVLITEKIDGGNSCLTSDSVFARTHSVSAVGPSFDWLKNWHAKIRHHIPSGVQLYCEYTYAVHSIQYTSLPSYLLLIAAKTEEGFECWDDVVAWAAILGIPTVPVISKSTFKSEKELQEETTRLGGSTGLFGEREGVVVRVPSKISDAEFPLKVGKWVRKGHVTSIKHWSTSPLKRQTISNAT